MNHINNRPYQLLKKDPTTKINAKTLKPLKALKGNELNPLTDLRLNFRVNQKYTSQEFLYILLFHVVATLYTILANT